VLVALIFLFTGCHSDRSGSDNTPSVARQWNEALLAAIRVDLARPTVHSRNLFHTSMAMYDAWAVFDGVASTYLLGKTVDGYYCAFNSTNVPFGENKESVRREAISFAAYRLLTHRFKNSPSVSLTQAAFNALLANLGYNAAITTTDYTSGSAAALGNYTAQCVIAYGLQDGANEQRFYVNNAYRPVNDPLAPTSPGNPDIIDLNRWQPLSLASFIDQSGNTLPGSALEFLGAEWGRVSPFALTAVDRTI